MGRRVERSAGNVSKTLTLCAVDRYVSLLALAGIKSRDGERCKRGSQSSVCDVSKCVNPPTDRRF